MSTHGLVVVEAPTGSGKSTRIPVWLESEIAGQVVVVQPRRVAASSLARFLAAGRGEPVGQSIGYRVRFDDKSSAKTRILFVTPGVMLRMLRSGEKQWPAAVVLDEFHERGLEIDLCAAVLLEARNSGRSESPLLLTSATLDGKQLADQIGSVRVTAEGRTFPVQIEYQDEPSSPGGSDLEDRVSGAVREAIRDGEGDILVFLPGKGEIDRCRDAIGGRLPGNAEILPFHANLPSEAIDRVFSQSDHRRVFLATNVAETSLTLPNVRTVIDSGLVRQMIHRGGRSALALMPTSQASLDQRAGRAGRTAPGRCIRLFSQAYQAASSDRPEIERLELDDLVVQAAACGLHGRSLVDAPWVTPPPEFALERAVETMMDRGVLDADGQLSDRGRALSDLPVSASVARAVLDAPEGLRGAVSDVIALVERGEGLLRHPPGGGREQVVEARSQLLEDTRSDVEAGIRILRKGHVARHGLSGSTLNDTRRTAEVLRRLIGASPAKPVDDTPRIDIEGLARHLLQRLPEQAFVLRPRAQRKSRRGRTVPYANGEIELSVEPWTEGDESTLARAGLVLRVFWSGSGKGRGVHGFGSLLLPCQPGWLAEAGLGDVEVGKINVVRERGATRLEAHVHRTLANVVLSTEVETLEGELAIDAAARLAAEGRLLKPASELAADALHLAEVARLVRLTDASLPFEDVQGALKWKLEELGVREAGDLDLVEAKDLEIDVAGMLAIDEAEMIQLARDLPRQWVHAGVVHGVRLERRPTLEVILEVEKTSSAKAKPPSPGVLPRFRDLPVRWRKASRTVQLR